MPTRRNNTSTAHNASITMESYCSTWQDSITAQYRAQRYADPRKSIWTNQKRLAVKLSRPVRTIPHLKQRAKACWQLQNPGRRNRSLFEILAHTCKHRSVPTLIDARLGQCTKYEFTSMEAIVSCITPRPPRGSHRFRHMLCSAIVARTRPVREHKSLSQRRQCEVTHKVIPRLVTANICVCTKTCRNMSWQTNMGTGRVGLRRIPYTAIQLEQIGEKTRKQIIWKFKSTKTLSRGQTDVQNDSKLRRKIVEWIVLQWTKIFLGLSKQEHHIPIHHWSLKFTTFTGWSCQQWDQTKFHTQSISVCLTIVTLHFYFSFPHICLELALWPH